jgi:hypothetical protein
VTALATTLGYLRPPATHYIPLPRNGHDREAGQRTTRQESCPPWCGGHVVGEKVREHASQHIEVRVGDRGNSTEKIRVYLAVTEDPNGVLRPPLVFLDDKQMTGGQARQLAAALILVGSLADPHADAAEALAALQHYGDGASVVAHRSAAEFAMNIAQLATRLQGMSEAIRLLSDDPEPPLCLQLQHRLDLAGRALAEIFNDLLAIGEPDIPMTELINRPDTLEEITKWGEHRQEWLSYHRRGGPVNTDAFCQPWCRDGEPRSCGGACLSEGEIIVATADGGRLGDDGMRYPMVEVYGSFSYPDRVPSVHLIPAGPYAADGTIRGWVELRPDEARRLAKAVEAEADRMIAWASS